MAKLLFDQEGERFFEQGVSETVLFPKTGVGGAYEAGVAWNGIANITKSPTGGEATPFYADNIKYANVLSTERVEGSIEAFTYPEEFAVCDGSAELGAGVTIGEQPRKGFAFAYKTKLGNDVDEDLGYKLHIVYNALASPTEKSAATINESPELATMNWGYTTTPVAVTGHKPTATVVIDSTKTDAAKLQLILDSLYGTDLAEPTLLMPDEIIAILAAG